MNLGNILFRTTGIMTIKQIKSSSAEMGRIFSELVASDGVNKGEEINKILQLFLGKHSKKIKAVSDKQEFVELCKKNLNMSEEYAVQGYDCARSMVLPKGAGDAVILNIRSESLPLEDLASTASHETAHALYAAFSLPAFIENLIYKIPKLKEKFLIKNLDKTDEYNQKLDTLQTILVSLIGKFGVDGASGISKAENTTEGLLKQCNLKSLSDLRTEIRKFLYSSGILKIGEDKQNKLWLESLIYNIKDEQRAYEIGGVTQRFYCDLMGSDLQNKAAKSELCARIYDEAIKVLKKEKKHVSQNIWRSKFKLKPKYASETKLVKKAQIEYIFNQIIKAGKKNGLELDMNIMLKNYKKIMKQIQSIGKKASSEGRTDFNEEEWKEIVEITKKVCNG